MRPAHIIEIVTPKKVILNGLFFGSKKVKRAIVVVHGLVSSAFSLKRIVAALADSETAVLTFNNRGHDHVASVKRKIRNRTEYILAGTAHEKFTDSLDDIQGAINFLKKIGFKKIYIAGHSTGAQKSIYWASRNTDKAVKGVILLAPLSDYADAQMPTKQRRIKKAVSYARRFVVRGKSHTLLPRELSGEFPLDAQRFLSLYTPDSIEEIFSYTQPNKKPNTLRLVKIPVLALFARNDEYANRPTNEIVTWFDENICAPHTVAVIPGVSHSFKGEESVVASKIKSFLAKESCA